MTTLEQVFEQHLPTITVDPEGLAAAVVRPIRVSHPHWMGWLERLGIDPSEVPVPSALVRDPELRRVWFWTTERDVDGHFVIRDDGLGLVQTHTFVQLEGPPPPFPDPAPQPSPATDGAAR